MLAIFSGFDRIFGRICPLSRRAAFFDVDEQDTRHLPKIPLHLVIAACPSLKTFYQSEIRHWYQLFDAACYVRPAMGIDKLVLSQPNVRRIKTGKFEIPAGGRRFQALSLLVKQKRLAKTRPIYAA